MIGLFCLITTTHLSEAIDLFEDIIAFKEDLINGNQYHKYLLIQSNRTYIVYLFISIFVFLFVYLCTHMIVLCMYSHCILSFVHFRTGIFGGINDLGEGELDLD